MRDYVREHLRTPPRDGIVRDRIVCKDGTEYSIQASQYHYCTPRDDVLPEEYKEVEVWVHSPKTGDWVGRDPEAYVPIERVNRRIHRHGGPINGSS